jgi:hypothetical protein
VLYVADDALWLADTSTPSPAVRVAGPLYSDGTPNGYYGEVDWGAAFAWSLGQGPHPISARLLGETLTLPDAETP